AAEAARREAAEAAAAGDAEAAAAAAALAAEAEVAAIEAEVTMELAEVAPVTRFEEKPKAAGIGTRQNWKAEVTDFRALVIAAGKAAEQGDNLLLSYLQADLKTLGGTARNLKGEAKVPGVRFYPEDGLSVRAA
ncbi:MAG TPA: hypothetical protein VIG97_01400, partial [Luteimonas sp.]